jgi:citrate lyase beta subunit
VLAVYREALAAGRASAALDGQMIDVPVAERAERLLARADAVAGKEAAKREALARLSP